MFSNASILTHVKYLSECANQSAVIRKNDCPNFHYKNLLDLTVH